MFCADVSNAVPLVSIGCLPLRPCRAKLFSGRSKSGDLTHTLMRRKRSTLLRAAALNLYVYSVGLLVHIDMFCFEYVTAPYQVRADLLRRLKIAINNENSETFTKKERQNRMRSSSDLRVQL